MDFDYGEAFGGEPPEAYERLLLDAMKGDATLYARGDWVDARLGAPRSRCSTRWADGRRASSPTYEAGTWGPPEADDRSSSGQGRRWRNVYTRLADCFCSILALDVIAEATFLRLPRFLPSAGFAGAILSWGRHRRGPSRPPPSVYRRSACRRMGLIPGWRRRERMSPPCQLKCAVRRISCCRSSEATAATSVSISSSRSLMYSRLR